jgi:hypothetical protein
VLVVIVLAVCAYVAFAMFVGRVLGSADDRQDAWEVQQIEPPKPDAAQDLIPDEDLGLKRVSADLLTA